MPPAVASSDASTYDINLYVYGFQPEHLDAQLVLPNRLPDVSRRGVDGEADDREHRGGVRERDPVEVLRVEDADGPGRQLVVVDAEALLSPVHL